MLIIITGASKGIGKALAEIFANDNKHTLVLCARNINNLDNLKSDIENKYPSTNVLIQSCDVSKKEDILAFADFILSLKTPVDILINNAGIFIPGSVYNEEEGSLEKMLQVNLLSAYHLTRRLIPQFISQKKGMIFNICSIASFTPYANGGSYSISKFALSGFTKNLREEMKPFGIKVCGVYPGATMSNSWAGSGVEPERIMEADDVAKMVYAATNLSAQAVMEDIVIRPQLGDL